MPMYRFRYSGEGGGHQEIALGFYRDQGALEHARRLAHHSYVEVWRENELVARLDRIAQLT
jgi:hypothetical protein